MLIFIYTKFLWRKITMTKLTKVLALVLVAAMLCLVLASCGKTLSGTYSAEASLGGLVGGKTSFTFKGSKVILTVTGSNFITGSSTTEYEGTYEITEAEDGTMSITFEFEDNNDDTKSFGGTHSFSENKDAGTIKIGIITYTKTK